MANRWQTRVANHFPRTVERGNEFATHKTSTERGQVKQKNSSLGPLGDPSRPTLEPFATLTITSRSDIYQQKTLSQSTVPAPVSVRLS